MLSVCIPIYNFDVRDLVKALHEQSLAIGIPVEIVCIDDCSDASFKSINAEVEGLMTHYVQLADNVGRSRIRNLFLNYTQCEYLLFLDCDCVITQSDFLSVYVDMLPTKPAVVCGGRVYPETSDREHRLRFVYGVRCESKSASLRRVNPNKSFMTNNFLIRRELLNSIRFDERLSRYGHEDTLFGIELKEQSITILHVQNPVGNGDIESNSEYLRKTKDSIRNLVEIYEWKKEENCFYREVSLLHAYDRLRRCHMLGLVRHVHNILSPILEKKFQAGFANMVLFKFYKLGLFISYQNEKTDAKTECGEQKNSL